MTQNEIYVSNDGSHSIISGRFGESYHSRHGALQESLHVFIEHGLLHLKEEKSSISLLEFGFGSGLNSMLTWKVADTDSLLHVGYTGLEMYPISKDMVSRLNYPELLQMSDQFAKIHEVKWNIRHELGPSFHFTKILMDFSAPAIKEEFDLIYYDPFAPSCQPEMWQTPQLAKVRGLMCDGAILVTYCAKGSFKRALKELGFEVEELPGPPGKREMIRAKKIR